MKTLLSLPSTFLVHVHLAKRSPNLPLIIISRISSHFSIRDTHVHRLPLGTFKCELQTYHVTDNVISGLSLALRGTSAKINQAGGLNEFCVSKHVPWFLRSAGGFFAHADINQRLWESVSSKKGNGKSLETSAKYSNALQAQSTCCGLLRLKS